jgi:hypothetical protein
MSIFYKAITGAGLAALLAGSAGCEKLPGSGKQQGAAIGGVGGAVAGAAVGGEHHRLLGALLGGAAGAGGGYLIGAHSDRISGHDSSGAQQAVQRAQTSPATPEQARTAPTADLNGDGFVTMDEVVAMRQAGLPDQVMLDKLQATGQVFELTPQQQQYLLNNGVSQNVVNQMPELNRDVRDRLTGQQYPQGTQAPPPNQPPPPPVVGRPGY